MKKIWAKIFSILLIVTFCFLGTGCEEFNFFDDLWEKFQNGDITEEEYYDELEKNQTIPMYGTKVLYRPDHYDFNEGSGGTAEEENDYYGKYAWIILRVLEAIYGTGELDLDVITDYSLFNFNKDYMPYLYDSIRYQVDEYTRVSNTITIDGDNLSISNSEKTVMSANLNNDWEWSFLIDEGDANTRPFLYDNFFVSILENTEEIVTSSFVGTLDAFKETISSAYSGLSSKYLNIYLGTTQDKEQPNNQEIPENERFYSDFVKSLEYVIYCYSLDLTPGEVVVSTENLGSEQYYQIKIIQTANGVQQELTPKEALSAIKETFDKLGSYVGVAERNKDKIIQWILDNVIGQNAMASDSVVEKKNAIEIIYDGESQFFTNVQSVKDFITSKGVTLTESDQEKIDAMQEPTVQTIEVGRNYASTGGTEGTVEKIVDKVCEEVTIGGDDVYVDDRFLASEIVEYYGESFTYSKEKDVFPYYEDFTTGAGARAVKPLEYQSAVLMFKKEVNISQLIVAFQYDADLDGYQTATGERFDGSRYIEIEVGLNFFDYETKTKTVVDTKTAIVPDGKTVDPLGNEDLQKLSKQTGISFSQSVMFGFDEPILGDWKKDLICGAFNVDIGGGVLKTDVGRNGYKGIPFVSEDPIKIVGNTQVKNYYEIIEPTEEEIAKGETYLSGQLNSSMFMGSDGCDYLEITYRVIKKVGDTSTNYKFYTGISVLTA